MHTFSFKQNDDVALGCEVKFDGRPLQCSEFTLDAKAGEITYITFKVALSEADIQIGERRMIIKKVQQTENTLSDTEIVFKL